MKTAAATSVLIAILALHCTSLAAQVHSSVKIGLLKYKGGGDWYANPTSLPNLVAFCHEEIGTSLFEIEEVEPGSGDIYNFPFLHMTGHGNVVFSDEEAKQLRTYLLSGGFLHVDDNYGMDPYVRTALKKVFPELELAELPFDHPIYHQAYDFDKGLPKIHEHDGHPPQGFGLIHEGRLLVFYSYESDLGDGWEDPEVHRDPEAVRQQALRMGANILQYALTY